MPDKYNFDELQAETAEPLAPAFKDAAGLKPDAYAEHLSLSQDTGLPLDVVQRNPRAVEKQADAAKYDFDMLTRETPGLESWLAHPDHAAVAQDDLDTLGDVEEAHRKYGRGQIAWHALNAGAVNMIRSLAQAPNLAVSLALLPGNALNRAAGNAELAPAPWLSKNPLTNALAQQEQAWRLPDFKPELLEGIKAGDWATAGDALVHHMALNAPNAGASLVGGLYAKAANAVLVMMGAQSAAGALERGTEAGLQPTDAAVYAATHGAAEVVFEKASFGLFKPWEEAVAKAVGAGGAKEIIKAMSKTLAAQVVGEGAEEVNTTLAQGFADYLSGVDPDALDKLPVEALESFLIGGAMGGALQGPAITMSGIAQGAQIRANTNAVKNTQALYDKLGELAVASKTAERAPGAFKNLNQTLAKGGAAETTYINVQAFEKYLSTHGLTADSLGLGDAYTQAKAADAHIAVPTSEWLGMAKTEHYRALRDDVTFDVNLLTANEARAMKEDAEREVAVQKADFAKAKEYLAGELLSSEKFSKEEAEAEAEVITRMVSYLAMEESKQTGAPVTALDYLKKNPVVVGPEGMPADAIRAKLINAGLSKEMAPGETPRNYLARVYANMPFEERLRKFAIDFKTGVLGERTRNSVTGAGLKPFDLALEGVKYFNDSISHTAGDQLYQMVAKALDKVAPGAIKSGGDFVFYAADAADAEKIVEALRKEMPARVKLGDKTFSMRDLDFIVTEGPDSRDKAEAIKEQREAAGLRAPRGSKPLKVEELEGVTESETPEFIQDKPVPAEVRERFDSMTAEQAFNATFFDPVSGMLNGDGFFALPQKKFIAHADLDHLGLTNKDVALFGDKESARKAGDKILMVAAKVMLRIKNTPAFADIDIAHISGDEYYAQSDNERLLEEYWKIVEAALDKERIDTLSVSGDNIFKQSITLSAGMGRSHDDAERASLGNKKKPKREAIRKSHGWGRENPGTADSWGDVRQRDESGVEWWDGGGDGQGGGRSLGQDVFDGPDRLARIIFPGTGPSVVSFFDKANVSSGLHEFSHYLLEQMQMLAAKPEASAELLADYATIQKFAGIEGLGPVPAEAHEKFVDAFIKYFETGAAPSESLQPIFSKFRVWLVSLWAEVRTWAGIEIPADMRQVFDRILTTDEAVADLEAQYGLDTPLPLDNPGYSEAFASAKAEAQAVVAAKAIESWNRTRQAWWKEQEAGVRAQIEKDVLKDDRIYETVMILQTGKDYAGNELKGIGKISKASVPKDQRRLLPKGVLAASGGVLLEDMATMLRYDNGDALLRRLREVKQRPFDAVVDELTAAKMAEIHPDYLTADNLSDDVLARLHNEGRTKANNLALEILWEKSRGTFKKGIRDVARRPPRPESIKLQAESIVAEMRFGDIKPHVWLRAESRAAAQAGKAYAAGDFPGAYEAKHVEALNHEIYKRVSKAKDSVKALKEFAKEFKKSDEKIAKTRDTGIVAAGRVLLAQYGLMEPPKEGLEALKEYDPAAYATVAAIVSATGTETKRLADATVSELDALADNLDIIWKMARRNKQIVVKGKLVEIEELEEELLAHVPEVDAKIYTGRRSAWENTKQTMLSVKAALRRVESWADAMGGPFHAYVYTPVKDAVNIYRREKNKIFGQYETLARGLRPIKAERIEAPELGEGTTFTDRGNLLMAMLHTGNSSNLRKLLLGRGWGALDADGNIMRDRWDAFIHRMQAEGVIDKSDWDFVQGVWDLTESLKAGAQKTHKRLYGYHFDEITAEPVATLWGDIRGGYMPAIADPQDEPRAESREYEAIITEASQAAFVFPSTGKGFTKKRIEHYTPPLDLSSNRIGQHLDKVLRFTYIQPSVTDVYRLVTSKQLRSALEGMDRNTLNGMLLPFLKRAASQKISEPANWGALDPAFRWLRGQSSMVALSGNIVNSIQQFTGFTVAAAKVKPAHLLRALAGYVKNPKEMTKNIAAKSVFMDGRTSTQAAEIIDAINDILAPPSTVKTVRQFALKHAYFMQTATQGFVNNVTWLGAYNQAVENGKAEAQAVEEADSAVRLTQGSFDPEDASRIESISPGGRLFIPFYGYFNMSANLLGTELFKASQLKQGAWAYGLTAYAYVLLLPAAMTEMLYMAMDGEDEDDWLAASAQVTFGGPAKTALSFVPGLSPVAMSAYGAWTEAQWDDDIRLSPVVQLAESVVKAPAAAGRLISDDTMRRKDVKDVLTAISLIVGVPVAQAAKPIGYLVDPRSKSDGPLDTARGLVSGR